MIREVKLGDKIIKYELIRKKVKNINLRIKKDGTVHVSANNSVPVSVIEGFILDKADAILKARESFSDNEPVRDVIYILGKEINVIKELAENKREGIKYNGRRIIIMLNDLEDDDTVKYLCRRLIEHISKDVLERFFEEGYARCRKLTSSKPVLKTGFRKTVWGTCHIDKNQIILNKKLVMLPPECIESVVVHEFCHFVSRFHDKNFYDTLESFIPDLKQREKLLREYEKKIRSSILNY